MHAAYSSLSPPHHPSRARYGARHYREHSPAVATVRLMSRLG